MSDDNGSAVKYEVESFTVYDVYRASNSADIAVSAEVMKLRDRVAELEAQLFQANAALEAADALFSAVGPYVSPVQNADYSRQLREHTSLVSAFAVYRKARGA